MQLCQRKIDYCVPKESIWFMKWMMIKRMLLYRSMDEWFLFLIFMCHQCCRQVNFVLQKSSKMHSILLFNRLVSIAPQLILTRNNCPYLSLILLSNKIASIAPQQDSRENEKKCNQCLLIKTPKS